MPRRRASSQPDDLYAVLGVSLDASAAEMLPAILAESPEPIVVVKRTDGGSEQNMKNASVQLADISLWKKSGADILLHTRPAANGSWVNDAEGAMPGANLALQHHEMGEYEDALPLAEEVSP